jgi:hypothetical protein
MSRRIRGFVEALALSRPAFSIGRDEDNEHNPRMTHREHWSPGARRLGITSAVAIAGIGLLYVGVIALWLVVEATPRAPIGDPYLAVMEGLTMASALALVGFVLAIGCFARAARRLHARAALLFGGLGAGLTMTVHFVQLTAVRQLWRAGQLDDYRLVWPSMLFAAEYVAWDFLIGLAMGCAGLSLSTDPKATSARRTLLVGGGLCVAGASGPLTGAMLLQNVAVLGYAIVLPIAGVLSARLFYVTRPSAGEHGG